MAITRPVPPDTAIITDDVAPVVAPGCTVSLCVDFDCPCGTPTAGVIVYGPPLVPLTPDGTV